MEEILKQFSGMSLYMLMSIVLIKAFLEVCEVICQM